MSKEFGFDRQNYRGLRGALRKACDNDSMYEPLWASFILTSGESAERLNLAAESFPTYTRHDFRHAQNVVISMEKLIGDERIMRLTPTDIWLLLMCAYTHDWGMTVSLADLKENVKNGKLKQHINKLKGEKMGDYTKAALQLKYDVIEDRFDNERQDKADFDTSVVNALNSQRDLMLILQSFFRQFHASGYKKTIDSSAYNAINKRLRLLVANIDEAHLYNWESVMTKLTHKTNGFLTDLAHPRYVAVMLRLADLLDLDDGRVNPFQVRIIANPNEAMAHQEKHLAVETVLATPERIEARFHFDKKLIQNHYKEYGEGTANITGNDDKNKIISERYNDIKTAEIRAQAAKLAFAWYDMMKSELQCFSLRWKDIVPEDYGGFTPTIAEDSFSVSFEGDNQVNLEDLDLRYELDFNRAFDIIRGAGLYRDRLTFIRELVQNAMDAAKIQLFIDWERKNGQTSKDKITIEEFFNKMPYDINEIAVEVAIERDKYNYRNDDVVFRVSDFGIGISKKKLPKLKHVGSIYDPEIEEVKERMPEWLLPTGSFGIGLQSVFDFLKDTGKTRTEFSMETRSELTNDCLYIIFSADKLDGGEIFYEERFEQKKRRKRNGTDVIVPLTDSLDILLEYKNSNAIDVFTKSNKIERVREKIQAYLKQTISDDIIPLDFIRPNREYGEHNYLKYNIFKKAFPKFSLNTCAQIINDKFSFISDKNGAQSLGFWYWDANHAILLKAFLDDVIDNLASLSSDIPVRMITGKYRFSFRGISVNTADEETMPYYQWDVRDSYWCDAEVYLLQGNAEDLLKTNREGFLDRMGSGNDAVTKMYKNVDYVLLKGFEKFLRYIGENCIENNDAPKEEWIKINKYLDEKPMACVLLALASYSLFKKTIDVSPPNEENHCVSKSHMVVIDLKAADLLLHSFNFLKEKLKNQTEIKINKQYYDVVNDKSVEIKKVTIYEMFDSLDRAYFTESILMNFNYDHRIFNELDESNTVIEIYADLFAKAPVRLFWSDLLFINNGKRRAPVPVYKYCGAAHKSLILSERDINCLYNRSYEFGQSFTKNESDEEGVNEETFIKLTLLFGERIVFPPLDKYEGLLVRHEERHCPNLLKNCGYVLISPFIERIFKDKTLLRLRDEIVRKNRNMPDIEKYNYIIKVLKNEDNELHKLLGIEVDELTKDDDPYGFEELVQYVRITNGFIKTLDEYEREYARFVLDYINVVLSI